MHINVCNFVTMVELTHDERCMIHNLLADIYTDVPQTVVKVFSIK